MGQLVADSGVGANANPIGGNWTTLTSFAALQRLINTITGGTAATDCAAKYTGTAFPDDQYAEFTVGATNDLGILVRCQGGDAYGYMLLGNSLGGSGGEFIRWASASYIGIQTAEGTWANGDVCRIEITGASPSTMKVFKNGVILPIGGTATDSSGPQTGGLPGSFVFGTGGAFTNFAAGDFLVPGTSLLLPTARNFAHLMVR